MNAIPRNQFVALRKGVSPEIKTKKKDKWLLQGRYNFQGLPISIENKAGSTRRGMDKNGHKWSIKMNYDYGYIRNTEAKDGDAVDVYVNKKSNGLKQDYHNPEQTVPTDVYVVHQKKIEHSGKWINGICPDCKKHNSECACPQHYDEDKVMLGFESKEDAIKAYLSQYDSPRFLGPVSTYSIDEFKAALKRSFGKKLPTKKAEHEHWHGVDLDGTLAKDEGWKGKEHIGEPIEKTRKRIEDRLKRGEKVKILTARASDPKAIPYIKEWLKQNNIPLLEITNKKDPGMISLEDDRAIRVNKNTGNLAKGLNTYYVNLDNYITYGEISEHGYPVKRIVLSSPLNPANDTIIVNDKPQSTRFITLDELREASKRYPVISIKNQDTTGINISKVESIFGVKLRMEKSYNPYPVIASRIEFDMEKAFVKTHTRKLKSGKTVTIKAHTDSRAIKEFKASDKVKTPSTKNKSHGEVKKELHAQREQLKQDIEEIRKHKEELAEAKKNNQTHSASGIHVDDAHQIHAHHDNLMEKLEHVNHKIMLHDNAYELQRDKTAESRERRKAIVKKREESTEKPKEEPKKEHKEIVSENQKISEKDEGDSNVIPSKQIIHDDGIRKAEWEPGYVSIYSYDATKRKTLTIRMSDLILSDNIRPDTVSALKKAGYDPNMYSVLSRVGRSDLLVPKKEAESIYKKARELQDKYDSERKRIDSLPSTKERREINAIYAKASRIANSNSEDNVWLPASLRAKADKMLEEWRNKYPKEANKEKADELRSRAGELRSKAKGALVYDADGWISSDEQKKRHDKMIRNAEELVAKADKIQNDTGSMGIRKKNEKETKNDSQEYIPENKYERAFPMSDKQEKYINDLKSNLLKKLKKAGDNSNDIRKSKNGKSAAADRIDDTIKKYRDLIREDPTSSKGAGPSTMIFMLKQAINDSWLVRDYA